MSLNTESNSQPNPINDDIKIEELESEIPTVHPESPIAHSPPTGEISQFDEPTEIDTKQETVENDLFKHEIHDESISMQE